MFENVNGLLVRPTASPFAWTAHHGNGSMWDAKPAAADLDGDGYAEVLVGGAAGGLTLLVYVSGSTSGNASGTPYAYALGSLSSICEDAFAPPRSTGGAAPALFDVSGDGLVELLLGGQQGGLLYAPNMGTPTDTQLAAPPLASVGRSPGGGCSSPASADLDGDGDGDVIVGGCDGTLLLLWNTGGEAVRNIPIVPRLYETHSGNSSATAVVALADLAVGPTHPALADLDGDGDYDLLVGAADGELHYLENVGDATTPRCT